jgi:hypothetical protein
MADSGPQPGNEIGAGVRTWPWPYLVFGLLAAAAAASVLWLGRDTSFWHDDCDFLHHRFLTDPLGLFVPHNDHAVVLPATAYRIVVAVAGTGSYLPFLALVQVAHIATAAGLYGVIARRSVWLGLGAAALFLFLGSGADNLFWAFQITFVGSTAFGVWALWAAERDRWPLAGTLLVGSVFCSLVGLAFVAAVAVIGLSRRQRSASWVALPVVTLGAWWLIFARGWERPPDWAVYTYGSPTSLESWRHVPGYAFEAAFRTVADVSGLDLGLALLFVVVGSCIAVVALVRGWRPSPLQLGALSGFLAFTAMVGVIRAVSASEFEPRFVYIAALFGLLMLPTVRRVPAYVAVAAIIFTIAMASNVLALPRAAELWTARADGVLACQP